MLLLSKASKNSLRALEELAESQGSLLEMRDKNDILLAVGTSIASFNTLKDKKGRPLYIVLYKSIINEKTMMPEEKVVYDVKLDLYQGMKQHVFSSTLMQTVYDNAEKYWNSCFAKWNLSNSVLKEYPDVVVNRIR